jgi:hypothetical protein
LNNLDLALFGWIWMRCWYFSSMGTGMEKGGEVFAGTAADWSGEGDAAGAGAG